MLFVSSVSIFKVQTVQVHLREGDSDVRLLQEAWLLLNRMHLQSKCLQVLTLWWFLGSNAEMIDLIDDDSQGLRPHGSGRGSLKPETPTPSSPTQHMNQWLAVFIKVYSLTFLFQKQINDKRWMRKLKANRVLLPVLVLQLAFVYQKHLSSNQ